MLTGSVLSEERELFLASEAEMRVFGARLSRMVGSGSVWYFCGPLGSGKTTLVRYILRALSECEGGEESEEAIPSPSFTLVQEYLRSGLRILHVDMWRLSDGDDFESLGLEEAHADGAAIFVEWPRDVLSLRCTLELALDFAHSSFSSEARRVCVRGGVGVFDCG
ncbi:MAG: tRNA (adenosine(37)-N6)-threonylcarbamoyltransferase complex ATPase subunit type 1 TsaE [Alphaproteobacteria bacterium]